MGNYGNGRIRLIFNQYILISGLENLNYNLTCVPTPTRLGLRPLFLSPQHRNPAQARPTPHTQSQPSHNIAHSRYVENFKS